MVIRLLIWCLSAFLIISCGDDTAENSTSATKISPEDTSSVKPAFVNLSEFLKGQLKELETVEVSPLYIVKKPRRVDSNWIKREQLSNIAAPFLASTIDSSHMAPYFQESSFEDRTIAAVTFTYEPKVELPREINVRKWDVYVDPNSQNITRVFIVKEMMKGDQKVTQQLTWKTGHWFKITNIMEVENSTPVIEEEQVIWKF
jgi:hypothetical protein